METIAALLYIPISNVAWGLELRVRLGFDFAMCPLRDALARFP